MKKADNFLTQGCRAQASQECHSYTLDDNKHECMTGTQLDVETLAKAEAPFMGLDVFSDDGTSMQRIWIKLIRT